MKIDEEIQKWEIELKKGFSKPMILMTLADKPTYPYQLTKTIIAKTNGKIAIAGSNIYPILKKMEVDGLIRSSKDEESSKKLYSLTADGKLFLQTFSQSVSEFLINMQENLKQYKERKV